MNEEEAAAVFQALSNRDRLALIRVLVKAGPDGLSAGDIAENLGASPSRTSFHLSSLTQVGCLTRERQSRRLLYRVNFERLGALMSFLLEDCCDGNEHLWQCCRRAGRSG